MKKLLFSILLILIAMTINVSKADEYKGIYVSGDEVYYDCPNGSGSVVSDDIVYYSDGQIPVPEEYNLDINSVKILNDRFFIDKNNVYSMGIDGHSHFCTWRLLEGADPNTFEFLNNYYQKDENNVYKSDNYWGWGFPVVIENAESESFQLLGEFYARDKNNVYFATFQSLNVVSGADLDTFEVLKEDQNYAIDKNSMYYAGEVLGEEAYKINDFNLYNNLKGKIILKVEENGEAYYVHPNKNKIFFLSRPVIAFHVMREQGIGIINSDLEKMPVANGYCPSYSSNCDKPEKYDNNFTTNQKGKIFLQVEENGEAWYVNPGDGKRYFLGRPTDAFNIMKSLGLGISNSDFERLIK